MEPTKKKPWLKLALYGVASCALYGMVFAKEATLTQYFTRGGLYSALPIATVFLFSWIHGNFAGALWSAMGIDGKSSAKRVETTVTAPQVRKPARPRATLHA
jgi:hypothetical protein